MIKERQLEIGGGSLTPARAAELLTELASLLGNCNDEIRKRDVEYNLVLLRWLDTEEKSNRAKIRAETSTEYLVKREARDTKELLVELIRSLKYYLRNAEEEYGMGKNQ